MAEQTSDFPSSHSPFHHLPKCNISLPKTSLTEASHALVQEHTSLATLNHCLRSACFALLLMDRIPVLSNAVIDREAVVLSCILHDMGWATTRSILSKDTRFEVDGANIARKFIHDHNHSPASVTGSDSAEWGKHRLQLVWDAIALHSTPSIASHKEPEVAATNVGIAADFFGSYFPPGSTTPGGVISVDEHVEIVRAFPREGFKDDLIDTMCFLCREKRETTFNNFVSEFGCKFGLDGKGAGKEEYQAEFEVKRKTMDTMIGGLDRCIELETKWKS